MNYFRAPVLLSLFLVFASVVQAIQNVTREGRYLYTAGNDTNEPARFYIMGIAYQLQGTIGTLVDNPFEEPTQFTDPLADTSGCERDMPYLEELSVNVVRVYSVNASLNHDGCMNLLSQNGIYVIIDLSLPLNGSIDSNIPTWSTNLLDQYINTIDAFLKYDNVLAYNVGNEVITSTDTTAAAPYVKAAARDTKSYLDSKDSSSLVGYAAIDASFGSNLAEFLSCGSGLDAIDIYGLNDYEWCGVSSFAAAYAATVTAFAQITVAAYFSEFGCKQAGVNRTWQETTAIYSTDMDTWSGAVAFSYFPALSAAGQFGIVNISGSTVTTGAEFANLANAYKSASPPNTPSKSDAGTSTYPSCPASNSDFDASSNLPPTPNEAACNCVENNLSCQYVPATNNDTSTVGALLGYACTSATCDAINGNGSTGVYGELSGCDPGIKLSFAMSGYYENANKNPQACDFAGNATANPTVPTLSASAVASSCFANIASVFTPSAPATSGSSPTSTSKKGSGSVSLLGHLDAIFGLGVMAIVAVMSAVWTLA